MKILMIVVMLMLVSVPVFAHTLEYSNGYNVDCDRQPDGSQNCHDSAGRHFQVSGSGRVSGDLG